jgi:hypothetical protein
MHRIILVTLDKETAASSAAVRQVVLDYLDEQGFADLNEKVFSGGWCDSFKIGGRFTGYLTGLSNKRKCKTDLGHNDDAQIVTAALYDRYLRQFEGESQLYELPRPHGEVCDIGFLDTDGDVVTPDFIGKKWLVVLDIHE